MKFRQLEFDDVRANTCKPLQPDASNNDEKKILDEFKGGVI